MPKNVSQNKDAKKLPTDTNFQASASTGHKVEIAGANTTLSQALQYSLVISANNMCKEDFLHFVL